MRMILKLAIIILCMIGVTAKAELTNSMFDIRHIGYSEGLSSQRVFSIVEDKHNVIWIATKAGIDRYNGHIVKSYTLPGNFHYGDMAGRRLRLLYDERYGLWAYDHTGRIYRYSVQNDGFEQDLYLGEYISGEIILNKLCLDHKGTLWFGLSSGLYKKEADGRITSVIPEQYVNDIISTSESLFIGTSMGVLQLPNFQEDRVRWLVNGEDVQTLFCDVIKDELWIGTFNNGLSVMNLKTSDLLLLKEQNPGFLNPIRAIISYDNHTMLVGIDGGGVYTVDRDSKKAHPLMSTEDSTDIFLLGNGIYAITKDRQGNIWIGSYSGGVSVAILSRYPITVLAHERGNSQSLANNNVDDIEENINGDLWFATDDGISILNASTRTWSHRLKGNVVVTLCKDEGGSVWAGTYGDGVYLLNSGGQVVRHLTKQQGLTTNYIFSIRQDMDGDIWVGGLDGDLLMMDKEGRQIQSYDIKWIHSIEVVDHNLIAVATVNGFCIVNKRSGDIQRYATFQEFRDQNASAYVISMLFNGDGTVWLGTEGGGLNLYDMSTRQSRTFTTREGLPSDDVYSLQQDSKGRLWASTGKGLVLIENFRVSDLNYLGNIGKEYNKSSFARLADGNFAYGSTNGVIFIRPDAIAATNYYQAPLRFTGLTIEYLDIDEEKQLRPDIYDMLTEGTIRLNYSHNSFAITFESINYRFQRDIAYQYILDGYEKSWSSLSSNGIVRYTNVSPGSYLLKVRSLRQSDREIISERTLILKVSQPWWNSWWAWVFYICMAGTFFYFILRYNSNRLQKKYDEDKIRFFIDTAHDIRTPVTLIMAPLDDLSREKGLPDKAFYYLQLARDNTRKLYTLITQLLEFEKVDTHKKRPVLALLNLNDVLAEEVARFQPLCDKKQLHLSLSLPAEDVYIMADRHLLEMLLDNLVSNACKYTMPQGDVCLSLNYTKRKAIVDIKDSGIGIPQKDRKYLFTDVHRAENARKSQEGGTGFGLLQVHRIIKMLHGKITFTSEENKGSVFTIILKRTNATPEPMPKATVTPGEHLPAEITDIAGHEDSRPENTGKQGDKDTLLIVEDHEALRYYLRKTFEYDYRVVDVADGQEALAYLSDEYPDLILSDVMMPGIQGDELCKLVKDNPNTSGIPFILLTAKVSHDAAVEGLKKGADDYIPKPFNTEILKLKVQTLIENRNRQRDFFMRQVIKQVEADKSHAGREKNREVTQTEKIFDSKPDEPAIDTLSESDRRFVMQATRLIIENMSNTDFNINILCREMAMSRTLFFSRLKSLTGKGPQEFIRIIRLQKAAELLKEGRNVTEVALETGFVNTKYFSSLFKKQFGVQPSKYSE